MNIDENERKSIAIQVCLCLCSFMMFTFLRGRFPPNQLTIAGAFVCCCLSLSQSWSIKNTVQKAMMD